jgi:tellurite resistance protein
MLDQPKEASEDALKALDVAPNDWDYRPYAKKLLRDIADELGYDPSQAN